MKKIISKLKYVKLKHILGIIPFCITLIPALLYKIYLKLSKKNIWLICEQHNTARDNGYHFFKYMNKEHQEIKTIYAIDFDCKDYQLVKSIGKVIKWGSLKHYFYYMACTYNVSSHKDGNPNQFIFTILHLYLNLFNNRVFLQHGITKDNIPMFYQENTKFKLFICGAKKEYEYITKNFHYNKNEVVYTGFARFDNLIDFEVNDKQIAIIPTWRNWLGRETNALTKEQNFLETEYFIKWNSLLNNKKLIDYINQNNINIIFYPHIMMQKFVNNFETKSSNIKILKANEKNIQELLKESVMLITDYSSVFFDFAYMKKNINYYQFDYEEYRKKQMPEGYFDYKENGFGPVFETEDDLVNNIIKLIDNKFKVDEKYKQRMDEFFEKHDKMNCERIYQEILKLK
jgi:CDP-glycerol glycerophosphotransferase (TagB/SpsB family)